MLPTIPLMIPVLTTLMHLGKLHAYEKALVLAVAFGPFVVLAAVVYVVRRRDLRDEPQETGGPVDAAGSDRQGRQTPGVSERR